MGKRTSSPENGAPSVENKPYRIVFEGNNCIGTGECASVSANWSMDLATGRARANTHFLSEEELEENLNAARACPARNGLGVIHIVDRRSGEEIYPDPEGDGTLSLKDG